MPTLLQINSCVNSGSTGRIAEELGQTVMNSGWKSYIAYGRSQNISNSVLIKIGNSWDINLHALYTRVFDKHGLFSKRATRKLIAKIRVINPDIIHLHNIHGYYLNYPILFDFLKESKIPVIWTLHDCWSFTGHCAHFESAQCEKWISQCEKCPLRMSYPASYLKDRSKKNYQIKKQKFNSIENLNIVAVSSWLEKKTQVSFLKKNKIRLIYNGVDLSLFKPTYNKLLANTLKIKGKFVLMAVATSWSISKGLYDYYELSKRIKDDEVLVLVGLTHKQIKKLPAGIIGLERTDSIKDLAELYTLAGIVLNLSYQETFGLTTVEGLACGTPSIVYNATASPELVSDMTGVVVEPGDIDGVLNAINKIKNNFLIENSVACRNRVTQLFNKDDTYQLYLDLYKELIKVNKHNNISI